MARVTRGCALSGCHAAELRSHRPYAHRWDLGQWVCSYGSHETNQTFGSPGRFFFWELLRCQSESDPVTTDRRSTKPNGKCRSGTETFGRWGPVRTGRSGKWQDRRRRMRVAGLCGVEQRARPDRWCHTRTPDKRKVAALLRARCSTSLYDGDSRADTLAAPLLHFLCNGNVGGTRRVGDPGWN